MKVDHGDLGRMIGTPLPRSNRTSLIPELESGMTSGITDDARERGSWALANQTGHATTDHSETAHGNGCHGLFSPAGNNPSESRHRPSPHPACL